MTEWWEAAPLAEQPQSGNWWETAPLVSGGKDFAWESENRKRFPELTDEQYAAFMSKSKVAAAKYGANLQDMTPLANAADAGGKDIFASTVAGRVAKGVADPVIGIQQAVPHAVHFATSLGGTAENPVSRAAADVAAQFDRGVQESEASYQQGRAEGGARPDDWDWGRIGGNVLSPVNYAAGAKAVQVANKVPTLAGRLLARGAGTGAAMGAMQPVTSAGDDFGEKKAEQAIEGAATGAVLGPVTEGAVGGIGKVADGVRSTLRYALQTPEQRAMYAAARKLTEGGVDAGRIAETAVPASARAKIDLTPSEVELVVNGRAAGRSASEIAREITAARGANGQAVSPAVVNSRYQFYLDNRAKAPLNIVERAQITPGSFEVQQRGPNDFRVVNTLNGAAKDEKFTSQAAADRALEAVRADPYATEGLMWAVRGAAKAPGPGVTRAASALMNRQAGQAQRLADAAERLAPGKYADLVDALESKYKTEMAKRYGDFYNQPGIPSTVFEDLRMSPHFRTAEKVAQESIQNDLAKARGELWKPGSPPPDFAASVRMAAKAGGEPGESVADLISTKGVDYIQRELRRAAGDYKTPGNWNAADAREEFLSRIGKLYPEFKGLRGDVFEAKGVQDAILAGRTFVGRSGERLDDLLREYRGYSPSQKDSFRVGMKQAILDAIANKQPLNDLTASMRLKPAQDAVLEIFGPKMGKEFIDTVNAEAATTTTKNLVMSGSQTTPLREAMDEFSIQDRMLAGLELRNPAGFVASLGEKMARALTAKKADAFLRLMLTTNDADVAIIARNLSDIQKRLPKDRPELANAIGDAARQASTALAIKQQNQGQSQPVQPGSSSGDPRGNLRRAMMQ